MSTKQAPSPAGNVITGHFWQIRRDVLGLLLSSTKKHGDVVRFRLGPLPVHLINHPDLIAHVLANHRENYDKNTRSSQSLRLVCGESLLTANGEAWHWRRKMVQPAFHHAAVGEMISTMITTTQEMLETWCRRSLADEPVEMATEMMRLTCRIIGRCLFGTNLRSELVAIEEAMHTIVSHTYRRWRRLINWPAQWRIGDNREFHQSVTAVNQIIQRLIVTHRKNPPATPNLLTLLLNGTDMETGQPVNEEQIRQEALVFLLAGHETTANALAWTFSLLTNHPKDCDAIQKEVMAVCGHNPPNLRDLPLLEHTARVFSESIRLYPPIWAMERRAIDSDTLAGYHIPKNSSVIISPYALHRHPEFWADPDRFDPDRFLTKDLPAYLPFGAGPRSCIGDEFAIWEARVILAMVLQRFDVEAIDKQHAIPEAGLTLRIKNGLPIRLRERKAY